MYANPGAIRFGEGVEKGLECQQAFPYIYSLVPSSSDTWEVNKGTNNLIDIGPTVAVGATIQHQVKLDPDYNFLLLWVKYTVYALGPRPGSTYLWYAPMTGFFMDPSDYQNVIGTPLSDFLRVAMWSATTDQTIYGGSVMMQNATAVFNGRVPVGVSVLQGYDYGPGQLRTPIFLPRSGMLMFQFTNIHTSLALTVGAAIYGLKVRI